MMASKLDSQKQEMVGIFWLVGDHLIIDASPLSEAEPYGDSLTHRNSHIDYWTERQRLRTVPRDVEYEEHPRGRVVYYVKTKRFALYADTCILKRKSLVMQIMKAMHLLANQTDVTTDGPDGHYKCARCLAASSGRHDNDWD
jgi:hypothetical protein